VSTGPGEALATLPGGEADLADGITRAGCHFSSTSGAPRASLPPIGTHAPTNGSTGELLDRTAIAAYTGSSVSQGLGALSKLA